MKKIIFMSVAMMCAAGPAMAQNQAALCKLWFTHKSKSAQYQPGVDVRGKPVVPADGGVAPVVSVPDLVRIPVTIELAQQLGAAIPAGMELEAVAGVVNIDGGGKVTYNGQDLSQGTYALCTGVAQPVAPAPVTEKAMEAGTLGTLPAADVPAHVPVVPPAAVTPEAVQAGGAVIPVPVQEAPQAITAVPAQETINESDIIWGVGE